MWNLLFFFTHIISKLRWIFRLLILSDQARNPCFFSSSFCSCGKLFTHSTNLQIYRLQLLRNIVLINVLMIFHSGKISIQKNTWMPDQCNIQRKTNKIQFYSLFNAKILINLTCTNVYVTLPLFFSIRWLLPSNSFICIKRQMCACTTLHEST